MRPSHLPAPVVRLFTVGIVLAAAAVPGGGVAAQVTHLSLTHAGRDVPVEMTRELDALGRAVAQGLLATADRDVSRPISDAQLAALGQRGTLLRLRLGRAEDVVLLRLAARERATRLAAYVPPDQDNHAFVFLGRSRWERIVVVDLPQPIRRELREMRRRARARE